MLEFPKWKYFLILLVLGLGVLYALPNVYQKDPSVQITANRSGQLDDALRSRVKDELAKAGVTARSASWPGARIAWMLLSGRRSTDWYEILASRSQTRMSSA